MEDMTLLSNILGVHCPLNTGKYLGLSSLVGRGKRQIFRYVKDRLWKKLQGWRSKKLSKAGKEILIKTAAQAIPTYCMSSFLLPATILDEFYTMMNSFWWGSHNNSAKGIKWMKWEHLCVQKGAGGRGFRDLHLFNVALLAKTGWRLLSEPSGLMCRVLKAKYFPHCNFLDADLGNNPSYIWSSVHAAQGLLRKGIRWKVGDGSNITIWNQPWITMIMIFI